MLSHTTIEIIGFVAATLNIVILFPQLLKTLKTKKTRDISAGTFLILTVSSSLWLIYAIATKSWPIVFSSVSGLASAATILALKAKYG